MTESPWSPEKEDELRKLTADGWSAGKIAEKFGMPRNAIIGKQHRMGISRARPIDPDKSIPHSKRAAGIKRIRLVKVPDLAIRPVCDLVPKKIGLVDLEPHHCRYPLDENGDDGLMLFCGHAVWGEHSYCASHCCAVFVRFVAEPVLEAAE